MNKAKKPPLETYADIAKRFKLHRNTVARYWKLPGAPRLKHGAFVESEVSEHVLRCAGADSTFAKGDPKFHALKVEEIKERVKRLRRENDLAEGTVVPRSTFEIEVAQMSSESQRVLGEIPSRLAPALAGLSVPEIEIRLSAAVREALLALRDGADGPQLRAIAAQAIELTKAENTSELSGKVSEK